VPIFKFIKYLASSPRLSRTRVRAVAVSVCFMAALTALLAIVPFPYRFRAPGVLEAVHYARIINNAPGYLQTVLVASGQTVLAGTPLIELSDRELELEIVAVEAQREESLTMYRKAMLEEKADLEPIRKRLETIEAKLQDLKKQKADLITRARLDGIWVAPEIQDMVGAWLTRGTVIGTIVDPTAFRFSAVVSQDEAAELFGGRVQKAEVRLHGQAGRNLETANLLIIPFQQEKLPSAALGWLGGGEVPVAVSDESGLQAAEPFFQIFAVLKSASPATLLHGRSGKLRFTLNSKPLLLQWGHKLRQLLQKRYRI
jgi:putative peptide zinc metalloprotease protein